MSLFFSSFSTALMWEDRVPRQLGLLAVSRPLFAFRRESGRIFDLSDAMPAHTTWPGIACGKRGRRGARPVRSQAKASRALFADLGPSLRRDRARMLLFNCTASPGQTDRRIDIENSAERTRLYYRIDLHAISCTTCLTQTMMSISPRLA